MIELKDLLEEDEVIIEFHMCHEYWTRNAIAQKGSTDISGALEMTLHRILEAGGSENDVLRIMGAKIPTEEELKDANLIEEENLRTKKQVEKLSVQNQLYDKIQKQTARQSTLLAKFMEAYAMEENEKERKKILGKIVVIGAYIKTQQSYPYRRAECNVSDKRAGIMLQGNDKESGMESCGSSFCHFSG